MADLAHLIIAGHGDGDPGAVGNGYNERDFTRDYIVDQIAKEINSVDGHRAVVYDKRQNAYIDTYNGGGIYWADKQGFATVTEFHLDAFNNSSAKGGHVIVYMGFEPDAIDLAMRDVLEKYVGIRYVHKGHQGISGRNNLLQVNVSAEKGVNYRLVELGFITNAQDVKNIRNNNVAIAKGFAKAITGKAPAKNKTEDKVSNKVTDKSPNGKTVSQLADEVIAGKHGTGDARKKSLGKQYNAVQREVNKKLSGTSSPASKPTAVSKPKASKTVSQLADEVIAGKHGTGNARIKSLGNNYSAVQKVVNARLTGTKPKAVTKTVSQLADEVIAGKHGTGRDRMNSLGKNYNAVQKEVNRRYR